MIYVMIVASILAIAFASVRPQRSILTEFEADRRRRDSVKRGLEEKRFELYGAAQGQFFVMVLILLAITSVSAVYCLGPVGGTVYGVLFALMVWPISQRRVIARLPNWFYRRTEKTWLDLADKISKIFSGYSAQQTSPGGNRIFSKAELLDLLKNSPDALEKRDNQLVRNSLAFRCKKVETIMTSLESAATIDEKELLGPIVLSELHRTRQDYIPVVDETNSTIVGIVHLRDFTTIDSQTKSKQAYQVMDKDVCFVNEGSSLEQTLRKMLDAEKLIAIVTKGTSKQAVGLVTLKDLTSELFG